MNREVCLRTEASFGLSESVGFLCRLLPPTYLFIIGEPGLSCLSSRGPRFKYHLLALYCLCC